MIFISMDKTGLNLNLINSQTIAQHGEIHCSKNSIFMHKTRLNLNLVHSESHKELLNMVKFTSQKTT